MDPDPGAVAVAIAPGADQADRDPATHPPAPVLEQARRPVEVDQDGVDVAVLVRVTERDAARGAKGGEPGAGPRGHVAPRHAQLAVADALEELALLRPRVHADLLRLGVDVSVRDQKVEVSVAVGVQEAAAPA